MNPTFTSSLSHTLPGIDWRPEKTSGTQAQPPQLPLTVEQGEVAADRFYYIGLALYDAASDYKVKKLPDGGALMKGIDALRFGCGSAQRQYLGECEQALHDMLVQVCDAANMPADNRDALSKRLSAALTQYHAELAASSGTSDDREATALIAFIKTFRMSIAGLQVEDASPSGEKGAESPRRVPVRLRTATAREQRAMAALIRRVLVDTTDQKFRTLDNAQKAGILVKMGERIGGLPCSMLTGTASLLQDEIGRLPLTQSTRLAFLESDIEAKRPRTDSSVMDRAKRAVRRGATFADVADMYRISNQADLNILHALWCQVGGYRFVGADQLFNGARAAIREGLTPPQAAHLYGIDVRRHPKKLLRLINYQFRLNFPQKPVMPVSDQTSNTYEHKQGGLALSSGVVQVSGSTEND
jgi:hypothetical protein